MCSSTRWLLTTRWLLASTSSSRVSEMTKGAAYTTRHAIAHCPQQPGSLPNAVCDVDCRYGLVPLAFPLPLPFAPDPPPLAQGGAAVQVDCTLRVQAHQCWQCLQDGGGVSCLVTGSGRTFLGWRVKHMQLLPPLTSTIAFSLVMALCSWPAWLLLSETTLRMATWRLVSDLLISSK